MKKWDDLGMLGIAWRIYWMSSLSLMAIAIGFSETPAGLAAMPAEQRQVKTLSDDGSEITLSLSDFIKYYQEGARVQKTALREFRDEIEHYVFDPCYQESLLELYSYETGVAFEQSVAEPSEDSPESDLSTTVYLVGELLISSDLNQRKEIYIALSWDCPWR